MVSAARCVGLDGGRALRHGFKHGGLGFRVGTIDFVEQHEIGVDRADLRGEFLRGEIEDLSADQVRRHQDRECIAHV